MSGFLNDSFTNFATFLYATNLNIDSSFQENNLFKQYSSGKIKNSAVLHGHQIKAVSFNFFFFF